MGGDTSWHLGDWLRLVMDGYYSTSMSKKGHELWWVIIVYVRITNSTIDCYYCICPNKRPEFWWIYTVVV